MSRVLVGPDNIGAMIALMAAQDAGMVITAVEELSGTPLTVFDDEPLISPARPLEPTAYDAERLRLAAEKRLRKAARP